MPLEMKRQRLQAELELLNKQHKALSQQHLTALDAGQKVVLNRRLEDLEQQIAQIENQLQVEQTTPAENPFTAALALTEPATFVGRQRELNLLYQHLQGGSVSLVGPPKIGKTSLMLALKRLWPGQQLDPIDCQGLEDAADFYAELADLLNLPSPKWRTIRRTLRHEDLLLIWDEFDNIARLGLSEQDLGRFRSVCQQNQNLHLLTVSRVPMREVFPDTGLGSPAYNFLPLQSLGPMPDSEARLLLSHPWLPTAPQFDSQRQATLLNLADGHPFKLQRAAYHAFISLSDSRYNWQRQYHRDVEGMLG